MEDLMGYYTLCANSVQLDEVKLEQMNCINRGLENRVENEVEISLQRRVELIDSSKAEIALRARVGFEEEGPFFFDIVYSGICNLSDPSKEDEFEKYTYDQVVPLLLPYVRECVASMLSRMGLPIFTIPTIDVLKTLEVNKSNEELVE
ncbi:protein-export chaperone SecB [Bacillus velezensis]|uniref:protein-export chaperone SecB n=1 Tax=Bacillus velezensis TaxID=492670 RepID=UPI002E20FD77|nr:protein-export chaperone SecB [Bacillus velezensis]MED4705224.1 protein-export chaperone SecB [Bacillus velezensis]